MTRNDYRVTVKVRNNNLLRAAEGAGLSIPGLACLAGVSYPALNDLVNMTVSPFLRNGSVRPMVERICAALNMPFDDLFSADQCEALTTNKSEKEVSAEEVYALTASLQGGAQIAHDDGAEDAVTGALESLTPRERKVIEARFGFNGAEKTLREIGDEFGVSSDRIRQIEQRALRKLRHPNISGELREFVLPA